jgi:hypothetical protein
VQGHGVAAKRAVFLLEGGVMKKLILAFLLILLITAPISANPYCTYGGGNCTYFTFECVERFWPWTPNIPRSWNACDWVQLIGQEKDGYQIIQVEHPQPGDVFVLPATQDNHRGHCGFIAEVGRQYDFSDNTFEEYYRVLESSMYADEMFPMALKGCRYRSHYYWEEEFDEAVFIRCTKK